MRITKLFIVPLTVACSIGLLGQQQPAIPSGITDPQPLPASPVRPVTPTRPVPQPESQQPQNQGIPAPAMPSAQGVLLRRIAMIDIPGRPGFKDVALVDGSLMIAHPAAATVDVFSLAKRRLVAQINGMKGASGIAVDPKAAKAYVANSEANEIAIVSTKSWQVEHRIPMKTSPSALLLLPDASVLYASNWRDQSISRIDLSSDAVQTVVVDGRPEQLVFDPATQQILGTLEDQRQVIVLDLSLRAVKRFPLAASAPTGLVLDLKGRRLYVAARYAVLALDADSGRELNRVAAPAGIDTLWMDAASNTLYGAATGGSILVMKTAGRLVVEREYATEVRGHSVAFDASKNMLYLPGGRDGRSKLLILRHAKADIAAATPQVAQR